MSETTYSLVFDRKRAVSVYQKVEERQIVLAVIASILPEPQWEGALVYIGSPPPGQKENVCVAVRGPQALAIQEMLVEGLERVGITVLELYEGGPEPSQSIARVAEGRWAPEF